MRSWNKTRQEKIDEAIQCLNKLAELGVLYGGHIKTRVVKITRGENNVYVWYEHSKASRPATATKDRFLRRRFIVDLSKLQ
jgi:hypothetical protein